MSSTIHADSTRQGSDLLQRAIALWRKAQVLYQGHSWQGQPEALAIVEQIAAGHPECEPMLADLLLDGNQLVVAYVLLTLEFMQSPVLLNLPAALATTFACLPLLQWRHDIHGPRCPGTAGSETGRKAVALR